MRVYEVRPYWKSNNQTQCRNEAIQNHTMYVWSVYTMPDLTNDWARGEPERALRLVVQTLMFEHHERTAVVVAAPPGHGLTLVHFSAQRKRFVWDRGCI